MGKLIHEGVAIEYDPDADVVLRVAHAVDTDGGLIPADKRKEPPESTPRFRYWTDTWNNLSPLVLVVEFTIRKESKRTWHILQQSKNNSPEQFLMLLALCESVGLIRAV